MDWENLTRRRYLRKAAVNEEEFANQAQGRYEDTAGRQKPKTELCSENCFLYLPRHSLDGDTGEEALTGTKQS